MVKGIEKIELLELPESVSLSVTKGDTIVLKFDQNKFDLDFVQEYANIVGKLFPKNNILAIFNGIEIGVIHNE